MNTPSRRRFGFKLAGITLAAAAGSTALSASANDFDERGTLRASQVFTSTNATDNNELLVFNSTTSGGLTLAARIATQGQGTGAGLGSQGAVTLSSDGNYLFVVNASSHTVSTFRLRGGRVTLASVTNSGGLLPISVTEYDGLVYVLNAGGAGNVAGFRNHGGQLMPLADGSRGLSAATGTNPAQVSLGADGELLVVTEKATSRITSYAVRADGTLGKTVVTASSGATPFGFAFDKRDHLIVSEAPGSAASSYRFDGSTPLLISGSVANTQAAACWLVVTPDGRFAYTANAGTSNLSAYRIARSGALTLAHAVAGSNGTNAGATDMAVTNDGRQLYALAPRSLQIVSYRIAYDGRLVMSGAGTGLPTGTVGLAAN